MAGSINLSSKFGVPIFDIELGDFEQHRQALIPHFLSLRKSDASSARSNQGGWHSSDDLYKSDHPSVQWLVRNLLQAGTQGVKQAQLLPEGREIVMSSCWVNINEAGDWNSPHNHMPDEWSGVVYIDVNEKNPETLRSDRDGDIMFFDPLPMGAPYQRAPTILATPRNGQVFLFPGYLMHMVAPHFDAKPRISVAFNLMLRTPGQRQA